MAEVSAARRGVGATLSTRTSASALLAIGGLHVLWATGSSWPLPDHGDMADAVAGRSSDDAPGPVACLAVAGLLTTAAAFVSGRPRRAPRLSRLGAGGVAAVLTTRGAFGLAGRTHELVGWKTSERFRRLDRRVYSPLCLTLAALTLPAVLK